MRITKSKNDKSIKTRKKELIKILRYHEEIDWVRTQRVHDIAYSIVQKMIDEKFEAPMYEVHHDVPVSESSPDDAPSEGEKLIRSIGWNLLHNEVLSWRPNKPRKDWTDIEKEIVHVLLVKDKIVCAWLLENINTCKRGIIIEQE